MARGRLRSRREVVGRVREIGTELGRALERLPAAASDPAVVDGVWQAEGLGMLLWALELAALAPYDRTFDHATLLAAPIEKAQLRDRAEIEHARESARLWHWRARTAALRADDEVELPPGWASFDQLIAVAALRGHERGLLPAPLRGDFPAFGVGYRSLATDQEAELLSIAYERHRALNWLCEPQTSWAATPTDT
jgi:hypothetical protein